VEAMSKSKRIALVGHCGPDSSYLRMTIKSALKDATIVAADDDQELHGVLTDGVDLILFNRELGYGFSETLGVKVIERLHEGNPGLKMMLVSNYAEAQAAAVAAGALPGFGKRELGTKRVTELLREALQ
jgi:two-component system, chemotaxis family, chemotaxis protein CheY